MSSPALPSDSNSGDQNPVDPSVDEVLHDVWAKNRNLIVGGFVLVVLVIVVRGGWDYYTTQREQATEQEYAQALSPEQLRSFIQEHAGDPLAGVAELKLADQAYAAGQSSDAAADYEQAAGMLKTGILAARARLGLAISQIESGQAAEGTAGLKELANDTQLFAEIRTEADYHLASLAADAGRADEVRQYAVQAMQADPNSPWTQRAFALQSRLPAPAAPPAGAAPAPAAPVISIPAIK